MHSVNHNATCFKYAKPSSRQCRFVQLAFTKVTSYTHDNCYLSSMLAKSMCRSWEQGQPLLELNMISLLSHHKFTSRYVQLSRLRSGDGVHLLLKIDIKDLQFRPNDRLLAEM